MVSRDGSSATGSFLLDAPLGRNVRIVAHCADEADVDTIEVVSPSGRVYDLPLVADGMLHVRIPHTDEVSRVAVGPWEFRRPWLCASFASLVQFPIGSLAITLFPLLS